MTKYIPTIGLEIHAELNTKTKMFCDCINNPDESRPNINICPICLGHPGTLPTLNKEAIKLVLKIGHAVGGTIADYTEWDRKNYFYPDIPKGYQISQYKYPLVSGGKIHSVQLTRIHLEEDTGTSIHDRGDFSLLNYNRAGVPLMELVTEPVIHSAKDAADFAKELQLLLRYLNASNANMEKGEMRVEANISVGPEDSVNSDGTVDFSKLGTKVEVKNLNSFKVVEKAINYEIERMIDLLESGNGDEIVQETRGWDETKQKTFSQRKKETSDDYRYFPEPDLPKLKISELPEFDADKLKSELPELPWEKRERLSNLNIGKDQIEIFINDFRLAKMFDDVCQKINNQKNISEEDSKNKIKLSANYLTTDLLSLEKTGPSNISPENIFDLIEMISKNEISSRGAKDILAILVKGEAAGKISNSQNLSVRGVAEKHNLLQQSDTGALEEIVKNIISNNQKVVEEYRSGKTASLQFLIGQGMKATKGSANPQILAEIFKKNL
ncbi:MAG TPA: Asp-tRNA(Asn)/Glu-tRNA(Gln) amidotransferase subunit GatB [Candidatus Paceibacterota bacterium]|nr:Asp-tRNA(Asn)/Glu-tRNA(Gln) amidotransferase subunit GatB [Candidatus Paceibacterota bacterium]HMP19082.1 Asp-tRNA(Asn)/Glu-tRNA(Gln) amidotransferase subunit GatB [Candidatus Paceibacterota bacterium]